jgi:integrase
MTASPWWSSWKLGVILSDGRHRLAATAAKETKVVEEVARFLGSLELRGQSPLTVRAYAYDALTMYRWLGAREEPCDPAELAQLDLFDFIRYQREAGAHPRSINRRLVVAALLYRFITGKDIPGGPGVSLPAPYYKGRGRDRNLGLHRIRAPRHRALRVKTPRTLVEPLSVEQVRALIAACKRYRDIAIVYLMLLCGLRSREALALRVCDVGLSECRLRVLGKGDKERVLPIPAFLADRIRDYLRLERPSVCHTDALFVVLQGPRRGHSMTPAGLRSLFRYRRRNEKIENANPHRLRHTFGADMARAGVRLPILQMMMGHSDTKMSLQYINLSMEDVAVEFHRAAKQIHKRYTKSDSDTGE